MFTQRYPLELFLKMLGKFTNSLIPKESQMTLKIIENAASCEELYLVGKCFILLKYDNQCGFYTQVNHITGIPGYSDDLKPEKPEFQ